MARVVYFWNKFKPEYQPHVEIKIPWEKGQHPSWVNDICAPYETIVDPINELHPKITGTRFMKKLQNRIKIKQKNAELASKNFKVLPKKRKPLPP